MVKNLPANAWDSRDASLVTGSGRSPREGNGNPLQYSWLRNTMDKTSLVGYSWWCYKVRHDWETEYMYMVVSQGAKCLGSQWHISWLKTSVVNSGWGEEWCQLLQWKIIIPILIFMFKSINWSKNKMSLNGDPIMLLIGLARKTPTRNY